MHIGRLKPLLIPLVESHARHLKLHTIVNVYICTFITLTQQAPQLFWMPATPLLLLPCEQPLRCRSTCPSPHTVLRHRRSEPVTGRKQQARVEQDMLLLS